MAATRTINLIGLVPTVGRVRFTRADYETASQFATVYFSLNGVDQHYGLRLDVNKRHFLDGTGDPEADTEILQMAPLVAKALSIDAITRQWTVAGRNLVICFDGPYNTFHSHVTNVIRLIRALDRDSDRQRIYYEPGRGSLRRPDLVGKVSRQLSDVAAVAFGTGLPQPVERAYAWLMDFWEPDDRIYLFGFSRGAYVARALAGLLHLLGLLPRGNHNLIPHIIDFWHSARAERPRTQQMDEFRQTFARLVPGNEERRFPVDFLGTWDATAFEGAYWSPAPYPFTASNPSIRVARNAVALDERRSLFRRHPLYVPGDSVDGGAPSVEERWFPGVHSDVGGGYAEDDGGLWRRPLEWIVGEAQSTGLLIDAELLNRTVSRGRSSSRPWNDPSHDSMGWLWWPSELIPKCRRTPDTDKTHWEMGFGRPRTVEQGSYIDYSTLRRIRESDDYRPANLSPEFQAMVRSLSKVPDFIRYSAEGIDPVAHPAPTHSLHPHKADMPR